jgi:hypothetical protein
MRKQSWFGIAFLFQDWVLIYHRLVYCLSFILWQLGPNYHNFLQLLWIKVPVSLMIVLVPITKHIRMCEINDACASLDLKLKSRKCQFEKTWSYCWNHSSWQVIIISSAFHFAFSNMHYPPHNQLPKEENRKYSYHKWLLCVYRCFYITF